MDIINKYYSHRANEYENIYRRDDPVRQKEQSEIQDELRRAFNNKLVLEIACGTGFWTETISEVADRILAIDNSQEVTNIAQSKKLKAEFLLDDAYSLNKLRDKFNAGCAIFWFSHIPKNQIQNFIQTFHSKLEKSSPVFIADNMFIDGIGGELIHKPGDNNTYKVRTLSNGSTYEVIKNYYNKEELKNFFAKVSTDLEITFRSCFWWIKYNTC